ncbi:helix-turn-helix transcriptional regulator [Octadecabacter antarcticus]|nr:helix-turn-helix transcriptional regulator [Octadecabacter antarcticus]
MNSPINTNIVSHIVAAYASGDLAKGDRYFEAMGGDKFAFQHGFDALGEILSAMPDDHWRDQEAAFCGLVLYLCKFGQAARAHAHVNDHKLAFEKTVRFTTVELLVSIHLGDPIGAKDLDRWTIFERQLPISDPLTSGLYCNSMLVILVRAGRLKEARSFGLRAIASYRAADHSHLEHFIHLHLADLSVMEGYLREGRKHLTAAKTCLNKWDMVYGNEADLSEIIDLLLDYETGSHAHIPARSEALRESLVSGDSWPEIFNQLGRISVLSIYFTEGRDAALSELAAYQIGYTQRHGRHSTVLGLLEFEVDRLDHSLGGSEQELAQLDHQNLKGPTGSVLLSAIVSALGVSDLSVTKVAGPRAEINKILQEAERQPGHLRQRLVQRAFYIAVREGNAAPFLEHRGALSGLEKRLTSSRFWRGHMQLSRMTRKVLHLVEQSYWVPPAMRDLGMNRRQLRIMTALRSGATNKEIARSLGLTEAGVKYHLSKLFQMTGARRRGQLIELNSNN